MDIFYEYFKYNNTPFEKSSRNIEDVVGVIVIFIPFARCSRNRAICSACYFHRAFRCLALCFHPVGEQQATALKVNFPTQLKYPLWSASSLAWVQMQKGGNKEVRTCLYKGNYVWVEDKWLVEGGMNKFSGWI